MPYTPARLSRSRIMYELYRELERNYQEISKEIDRTLNVLEDSGRAVSDAYLAATRAFRALSEAWSRHLEIERELFPRILCSNWLPAETLLRIAEGSKAIEKQLTAILTAPWPRWPQAGLKSIRITGARLLTLLLAQIDAERASVLPAISRMVRRGQIASHAEPEVSELLAT